MDPAALRNRLVMATSMWREATDEPLPKIPPGDPAQQIQTFELQVVELLFSEATPGDRAAGRRTRHGTSCTTAPTTNP